MYMWHTCCLPQTLLLLLLLPGPPGVAGCPSVLTRFTSACQAAKGPSTGPLLLLLLLLLLSPSPPGISCPSVDQSAHGRYAPPAEARPRGRRAAAANC
jgi:hypothetical protein